MTNTPDNELDKKEAIHCEVTNKVIRMTGPGAESREWTMETGAAIPWVTSLDVFFLLQK